MSSLRSAAPRPSTVHVAPTYPRLIAIGVLVLAGCGGAVDNQAASDGTTSPTGTGTSQIPDIPVPGGAAPAPFDAGYDTGNPDSDTPDSGTPDTGASDAAIDSFPNVGGGAPYAFDADVPD